MQLDGFDRRGSSNHVHLRHGQDLGDVDADHAVLLYGVRAFDREHVSVPVGPNAGREFLALRLYDLERNPHSRWEFGRGDNLCRANTLFHPCENRPETPDRVSASAPYLVHYPDGPVFARGCRSPSQL